jgi:hypothetical protein
MKTVPRIAVVGTILIVACGASIATSRASATGEAGDFALSVDSYTSRPRAVVNPRRATRSEQRAIAGADARCLKIYISTINRRYGSTEFDARSYAKDAHCRKIASDGVTIVRRHGGRWREVGAMSDCPHAIRGVPARIYRELTRRFCEGHWRR